MPEVTFSQPTSQEADLTTYLGIKSDAPMELMKDVSDIMSILYQDHIDSKEATELFQSFERRFGLHEDSKIRTEKFLAFLKDIKERGPILHTVKSMGLLSKTELRELAKETGDWTHLLRRLDKEKKNANR